MGKAESNDEVIVTPGTYALTTFVRTPAEETGIDIHGQAEQPRPKLVASLAGAALEVGEGDRVSDVEIENTEKIGTGIACRDSAVVDRVRVMVSGEASKAVQQLGTCGVRDSLLRAGGAHATGLLSSGGQDTAVGRNLTVIVSGTESIGVSSEGEPEVPDIPTVHLLDLGNSIVRAEGTDLVSNYFFSNIILTFEAAGNIAVAHSNFATSKPEPGSAIAEGPGNQKAAPIFVDAELGDYTEAAASPTVDAGVIDQLGPLDLAGRARVQGPAPDIGAYEFPAPEVVCECPLPRGIRSLSIRPKRFRPAKGAVVTFRMAAPGEVSFSVSKKIAHRRAYRPLKGSFSREGEVGENHFTFHARIGGRTLKPGRYKLTGLAGQLVSAGFEIAGGRHHRHHR